MVGKYTNNTLHWAPFLYRCTSLNEWFSNTELPTSFIRKAKKLFYVRNGFYCFSDLHLVAPLLVNPLDRIRFMRMLYRSKGLAISLEIEQDQDISEMVEYWGRYNRKEIVAQHLEAMSQLPRGGKIDLVHLLPPIPRLRLNTYMGQDEIRNNRIRDCAWVMFNFFNVYEDPRVNDYMKRQALAEAISAPLNGRQPRFGDIVNLVSKDNELCTPACTMRMISSTPRTGSLPITRSNSTISETW